MGDAPEAPRVQVLSQDDATVEVRVEGAAPGSPCWLVLGQSHSPGWALESAAAAPEATQRVDRHAHAFLLPPRPKVRRARNDCGRTCRSWRSPNNSHNNLPTHH